MRESGVPVVAIVDCGMGNLYSVQQACHAAGVRAEITSEPKRVQDADGIVLPGVGAFGDAMETLRRHDLVDPLQEAARQEKPFMGVCLGFQLMASHSEEFGRHDGLGLVAGSVVRLENGQAPTERVKVPQVGWNRIWGGDAGPSGRWAGTALDGIPEGAYMYFVHSFHVRPNDDGIVASRTRYGPNDIVSAIRRGNLFGCQFHPERSGPLGLQIYQNFRRSVDQSARPAAEQPVRRA